MTKFLFIIKKLYSLLKKQNKTCILGKYCEFYPIMRITYFKKQNLPEDDYIYNQCIIDDGTFTDNEINKLCKEKHEFEDALYNYEESDVSLRKRIKEYIKKNNTNEKIK